MRHITLKLSAVLVLAAILVLAYHVYKEQSRPFQEMPKTVANFAGFNTEGPDCAERKLVPRLHRRNAHPQEAAQGLLPEGVQNPHDQRRRQHQSGGAVQEDAGHALDRHPLELRPHERTGQPARLARIVPGRRQRRHRQHFGGHHRRKKDAL